MKFINLIRSILAYIRMKQSHDVYWYKGIAKGDCVLIKSPVITIVKINGFSYRGRCVMTHSSAVVGQQMYYPFDAIDLERGVFSLEEIKGKYPEEFI